MKRYTKEINGKTVIKTRQQIIISKNGMSTYNPTEEMILADGWVEYIPSTTDTPSQPKKDSFTIMQEIIFEQYNAKTDISDEEALDRSIIIYDWDHYIGKSLTKGQVVVHNDNVYRVRQDISEVLDIYPPDITTASLYEVIVLTATGEENDPILYIPPMEIFNGKYYIQNNVIYKCIRDSGTALSHDLSALVGMYVEIIENN